MKKILPVIRKCREHGLINCPTCERLLSDAIIAEIEASTKDLKPIKTKNKAKTNKDGHTKDST